MASAMLFFYRSAAASVFVCAAAMSYTDVYSSTLFSRSTQQAVDQTVARATVIVVLFRKYAKYLRYIFLS